MAAVLCDVDGTLVDTTYLHTVCWWQVLSEAGHRLPMTDIHAAVGMGADLLVPHLLGREPDADEAGRLADGHDLLFRSYWDRLQPTPGATEFVRACAEQHWSVVLVTSAGADELGALRRAINADAAITAATSADDVATSKPAPDLVRRALDLVGGEPGDAVLVGDTVWDIQAASRAGVTCIALESGGTSADELRAAGAEAVYAHPAALLAELHSSPLARLG
jgi:HAD superfamily hydrolase (TIGR01509 family)